MKERLSTLYKKAAALEPAHKAALAIWAGSWTARTALWPIAAADTYLRLKGAGAEITTATIFNEAATILQTYGPLWAALKVTQWSSMAYLGAAGLRNYLTPGRS